MTFHIDMETAKRLVKAAVDSKPEGYIYVNNAGQAADKDMVIGCDYFTPEGKGSCIVGTALLLGGLSYEDLKDGGTGGFACTYLPTLAALGVISIDRDAVGFLAEVQGRQDNGMPWAEAYEQASNMRYTSSL